MSVEGLAVLANMLIIGGVGGYFAGWFLKKTIKLLLIGSAIVVFVLAALAYLGTINVNYDGLLAGLTNLFSPSQLPAVLQALASFFAFDSQFCYWLSVGICEKIAFFLFYLNFTFGIEKI